MKAIYLLPIFLIPFNGISQTNQKPKEVSCNVCYFRNQTFTNDQTSSLNSIFTFKCQDGKWFRIGGTDPFPGRAGICIPCSFQGETYSEGAISDLNSTISYRCSEGNWVKR